MLRCSYTDIAMPEFKAGLKLKSVSDRPFFPWAVTIVFAAICGLVIWLVAR